MPEMVLRFSPRASSRQMIPKRSGPCASDQEEQAYADPCCTLALHGSIVAALHGSMTTGSGQGLFSSSKKKPPAQIRHGQRVVTDKGQLCAALFPPRNTGHETPLLYHETFLTQLSLLHSPLH